MLLGLTGDPLWPAPTEALAEARQFLERQKDRHVLVAPYPDVDGLASGVLTQRALLERRGVAPG